MEHGVPVPMIREERPVRPGLAARPLGVQGCDSRIGDPVFNSDRLQAGLSTSRAALATKPNEVETGSRMKVYFMDGFAKAKNALKQDPAFAIVFLSFMALLSLSFFYKASIPYLTNLIFREAQNDSIARDFFHHGINLFYPRSYAVPPPDNYLALDFPILEALVSMGYHVFGETVVVAKTINVISFLLAELAFFFIVKKLSQDKWLALLAMAISSTGFMSFFYMATFMLEPFALLLTILTVTYGFRYIEKEHRMDLLAFFLSGLLASLVKVFLLIPFCFSILFYFLLLNRTKPVRWLLKKSFPFAISVILWMLCLATWFKHVESLASKTSALFMGDSLLTFFLTVKTSFPAAWQVFTADVLGLTSIFPIFVNTKYWLLSCAIGAITLLAGGKKIMSLNSFVFGGILGFVLMFFSFNSAMDHTYYYMPLIFMLPVLAAYGVIKVVEWSLRVLRSAGSITPGVLRRPQAPLAAGSILILLPAYFWEPIARRLFSAFNNQFLYRWNVDSSSVDRFFYWLATGFIVLNLSCLCLYLYRSKLSRESARTVSTACFIVLIGVMIYPVHITEQERYYRLASAPWTSNTLNGVLLADTEYVKKHTTREDVLVVVSGRGRYYPEFFYYADRAGFQWTYQDFYCYLFNPQDSSCINKTGSIAAEKIFVEYTPYNYWSGYFPATNDEIHELILSSQRVTLVNIFTTEYDHDTYLYELEVKKDEGLLP
jgi:hypothetical protein